MVNIAEWKQDARRPEEITIKAGLRGGLSAVFQLDRNVTRHLARFCVLHMNIKNRFEEIVLCDFKGLKKIPDQHGVRLRNQMGRSYVRDGRGREEPMEGSYSIEFADKSDKSWLGPDGRQEARYNFEFTAVGEAETVTVAGNRSGGGNKKAYLAAAVFAVVVVAAGSAPLVSGYLSSGESSGTVVQALGRKSEVMHAALVPAVSAPEKSASDGPQKNVREDRPAQKVKARSKALGRHAAAKGHAVVVREKTSENRLDIPCTKDMIAKGISCN
jgi:hypothetical protein